jgi:hypothetical protein
MKKKKVLLAELGKAHVKEHLKKFHPFLKKEYRTILKSELNDVKVLHELFGESETEFYKLTAVYEIQKI